MAPRTRATAPRPPPAAVPAPRQPQPPPAARRRRQGLPTLPGRAASGRLEEEPQEGPGAPATPESGADRPGGLPSQHGPGRERRREGARNGSPPVRKARVTPVASPLSREVNRPVTTGFRKLKMSTQANADMGNEDNDTTATRIRTDNIESLRRRLIVSESKVVKEKDNVRRGLEHIRRKDAQFLEMTKYYQEMAKELCTTLERTIDLLVEAKVSLRKLEAEKEAEILELQVQKQAEVQKVKAEKEAEVQEVIKEKIRLLCIVDKKEAQLQAMGEHCKLLTLKNTTVAADIVR